MSAFVSECIVVLVFLLPFITVIVNVEQTLYALLASVDIPRVHQSAPNRTNSSKQQICCEICVSMRLASKAIGI